MKKYIKRYFGFIVGSVLSMVVEVSVDLLQPSIMTKIVDDGVLGANNNGVGDINLVLKYGLIMLILIICGFLGGASCAVFANNAGERITNDMRKDSFKRILNFSFPQIDRFGTGSLITRITNDLTQVRNMIETLIKSMIRTGFFFGGSIFFMFRLYPQYGFIALCVLPFISGAVFLILKLAAPGFSRMQEQLDEVNAIMQEDVSGIRIIKACVREIYEKVRFGKANDRLISTQLHVLVIFAFLSPVMNIMMYAAVIAIILFGSFQASSGTVRPGAIMGAISYSTSLLNSVLSLAMQSQNVARGNVSWKRVKKVLETEGEVKDGDFESATEIRGRIEFKDVSFTYPGASQPVLCGVNLVINPGETVAIMGATGCGKTTLINLIPRFYDVCQGSVLVDGVDVREYRQKALREKIAVALQKSELFGISASENIRWGKPDSSMEEIVNAAKVAQADDFIREMPDGYDEIIAERGMSLSGGQRQRMSISRTVLKDAEIYIFDDSTSALDLKTEAAFYDALSHTHPDSTKIIVAQRIASIRNADHIAILEDGVIAAYGTHDELLADCSIYQMIYNSQMGEEDING